MAKAKQTHFNPRVQPCFELGEKAALLHLGIPVVIAKLAGGDTDRAVEDLSALADLAFVIGNSFPSARSEARKVERRLRSVAKRGAAQPSIFFSMGTGDRLRERLAALENETGTIRGKARDFCTPGGSKKKRRKRE